MILRALIVSELISDIPHFRQVISNRMEFSGSTCIRSLTIIATRNRNTGNHGSLQTSQLRLFTVRILWGRSLQIAFRIHPAATILQTTVDFS
jgi:hypothetical protein